MEKSIIIFLFIALGLLLVISVATTIYQMFRMLREIDRNKGKLENIFPLAVAFTPWLLTDAGKKHQSKFVVFTLLSLGSAVGLFIIDYFKG